MKNLTVAMQISLIARLQRRRFDERSRDMGLTLSQWRGIAAIRMEPGATQHRIATILEVGDVTAGRMIDKLCEEGFVERREDPNDRRANRIYPKATGAAVFDQLSKLGEDEARIAHEGLSGAEQEELSRLLGIVLDNLTRSMNDAVPDEAESLVGTR